VEVSVSCQGRFQAKATLPVAVTDLLSIQPADQLPEKAVSCRPGGLHHGCVQNTCHHFPSIILPAAWQSPLALVMAERRSDTGTPKWLRKQRAKCPGNQAQIVKKRGTFEIFLVEPN